MLGLLASLVREQCPCSSCTAIHECALQLSLKRLRTRTPPAWDDDLSDADLEALGKAGWPEEAVREHIETLRRMLAVLNAADSGEPGPDYVPPDA